MGQTLAARPAMNQTRLFIVLTAILWLMLPTQSHAQFGRNRPKAFGNSKAEPVWLLPSVEGPNLRYKTFQSASVKAAVSYVIYLPAEYEANKTARYPVVYWLHGKGAGQQGLPGFARSFNEAIASGKCPPMIVVYPNGLPMGGYTDSPDGKQPVESMIIRDLIPHIDANYRTLAKRESRMIEGFSMGGSGAAKLGFKYPELFGAISLLRRAAHSGHAQRTQWRHARQRVWRPDELRCAEQSMAARRAQRRPSARPHIDPHRCWQS